MDYITHEELAHKTHGGKFENHDRKMAFKS